MDFFRRECTTRRQLYHLKSGTIGKSPERAMVFKLGLRGRNLHIYRFFRIFAVGKVSCNASAKAMITAP